MAGLIGQMYLMMNLMKKTGLAYSAWFGRSEMVCRGKLCRLDWSGGPDGDR